MKKAARFQLIIILLLSAVSFLIVFSFRRQLGKLFGISAGREANIVVDVGLSHGQLVPIWRGIAQGGEEPYPFGAVIGQGKSLSPAYVRIDHIYDFYNVVSRKENGSLAFDWAGLDRQVDDIARMGAVPFLSLSYMPSAIARGGDPVGVPDRWEEWALVVQRTVEHYSGIRDRSIPGVVYEVWNEPDLFGNWRLGGNRNYLLLYQWAVRGAMSAKEVWPFRIGGPSVTAPYKNWVFGFLDYMIKNDVRVDFFSWHRYSKNPLDYLADVDLVDSWMSQNPTYKIDKYITEWGSDSENSPVHDSGFDAAHYIATMRWLIQRVDLSFAFELKDGPSGPDGSPFWGRWGLLTHEKYGPVIKKPKYNAVRLLGKMMGDRIGFDGEGDWVTGFSSKFGNTVWVMLSNYDRSGAHSENVPVTINNLDNGPYSYQEFYLDGDGPVSEELVDNGTLQKQIIMSPNSVVLLQITRK